MLTGSTASDNFPTKSAYQWNLNGRDNAFVTKLAPAGNALVYSTYLGGTGDYGDSGYGIAVDAANSAYATGTTTSKDFPTQSAYQTTNKRLTYAVFVTKFTPAGNALAYSTYLGGTGNDYGSAIGVDGSGSAYVTGHTDSPDFPTRSAYQATLDNVYGNAFVTKLAAAGNALVYSTYLGGSGNAEQSGDRGNAIAVDSNQSAYVTGTTNSADFPTHAAYQSTLNGIHNVFVTKLATAGNALAYSTYLGGSRFDYGNGIAVDSAGSAYVTGNTDSSDFPTQSAYQATLKSSNGGVFVTKLATAGNALVYSTYLSGTVLSAVANGIAVDGNGAAYITGYTAETNFPTVSAFQTTEKSTAGNVIVAKLTYSGSSSPTVTITTNPSGLAVTVDGTTYTAPQSFSWTSGSQHTTAVSSPQGAGTRYVFSSWSDGGAVSHTVTAPSSSTTYTANFTTQYLLTSSVSGSGSIAASPTSTDGYYASGASVQLTASPSGTFTGWSGDASGTSNPITITMDTPKSVTASFGATLLPDLVITSLTAATTGTAGAQITILNLTVVNQGTADAGPLQVKYYFSPTPNINIATAIDTTYYCNFTNGIAAGTTHYCANGSIRVPSGLTSGTWYLGAIADPTNQITESNKNNNARVADSGPVQVTAIGLAFYPVTPCRVADTRGNSAYQRRLRAAQHHRRNEPRFRFPASGCNIPSTAAAYSLNVTVVPPGQLTYLSMWPTGQPHADGSTLNDFSAAGGHAGQRGGERRHRAGGHQRFGQRLCERHQRCDYRHQRLLRSAGTGGLAFYSADALAGWPTRAATGQERLVRPAHHGGTAANRSFPIPQSACNVPSTAQAYSLNMTAVPPGQLIYLTTWPSGQSMPTVSTLNDFSTRDSGAGDGQGGGQRGHCAGGHANGAVSVFVSDPSDVIIDINGYFAPPGGPGALSFYPTTPCRIADTRSNGLRCGEPSGPPTMAANATRTFPIPQSSCVVPSTRAGVLAEHGGAAAGSVDLPDHMAERPTAADGLHPE